MKWRCCACGLAFEQQHEMRAHVEVCDKHPLAFALASNRALSEALSAVLASALPNEDNHPAMWRAWRKAKTAIASHGVVTTSVDALSPK